MDKPNSCQGIKTTLDRFFTEFLVCMRPYHGMTDSQIALAAQFLKARYELSKSITDEAILDEHIMSETSKRKIRDSFPKMKSSYFQVLMGDLRKHRFIVDDKINKKYIPNLSSNPKNFSLMFYFTFDQ